ncbi:hypothetical protein O181_020040 [Austropuccinia psidii MF-1]|uniref:Uncharacterized protein n=1 Tax=Austropuccinia psidii MF-1 TaxID=1389203 RepID=A0A9Q3GVP6_9BASI|nr:hypothetical protein [Austropuccinia psidii MF-1]
MKEACQNLVYLFTNFEINRTVQFRLANDVILRFHVKVYPLTFTNKTNGQRSMTILIIILSSFLLGSQFTHWVVDHRTLWTQPIQRSSVSNAITYYSHINSTKSFHLNYFITISQISILVLCYSLFILISFHHPQSSISSTLFLRSLLIPTVLLLTTAIIHQFQVTPILSIILNHSIHSADNLTATRQTQSLAASHTTISVALTGLISLQLAQITVEKSLMNSSSHSQIQSQTRKLLESKINPLNHCNHLDHKNPLSILPSKK